MPLRAEQEEEALIESVCARLPDEVSRELIGQCEAFVWQFYHWVPQEAEDLLLGEPFGVATEVALDV
jgi:hypothetical protein